MSIIIKNEKMPDKCSECKFCSLAGMRMERLLCMFTLKSEVRELIDNKLPDCPLIELPENYEQYLMQNNNKDNQRDMRSSQYYHGGWIPVSERLPEENGLYLVTVNAQIRPVRIYEYAPWGMDEERKYWLNDCDDHSHVFNHFVKAWMPCFLPEPYREEGEN